MRAPDGAERTLDAKIYDHGDGLRHHAVVINHGSPRDKDRRRAMKPGHEHAAKWFHGNGYVVVVPMRRGYGTSEGEWAESYGKCEAADFRRAGLSSANDIQAVVDYTRRLPSVEPSRVILVGQSAGGWGALALASRAPEGVVAIINFAGGRGSPRDGENCSAEALVRAAGEFGRGAKVPSLWLYAENDQYFAPALARRLFDTFSASSTSTARFVQLPAFGRDGHVTFSLPAGAANWQPAVAEFLASLPR